MALPTNSDVHVDSLLTNISIAYMQERSHFIADQVFPRVPVNKQSDKYATYTRADFNRDEAEKRAPGTETAGGGYRYDTSNTYFCDLYGFHKDVDDQTAANQDIGNPYNDAIAYVAHKMLINKEVNFNTTFMTGGLWDNDYDGVASGAGTNETIYWSDATDGTPIEDIRAAKSTILSNTGIMANTLVIGHQVYDALVDHPDIVDRIKYSGGVSPNNPAIVNTQALAQLFDVDRVLISKSIKNATAEGGSESSDFIIGKKALLVYAAPNPSLMTPSGGYTFSWSGYLGQGNEFGAAVSRFRMDHLRAERIEMEMAYDQKLVSADVGFFWDTIVS